MSAKGGKIVKIRWYFKAVKRYFKSVAKSRNPYNKWVPAFFRRVRYSTKNEGLGMVVISPEIVPKKDRL